MRRLHTILFACVLAAAMLFFGIAVVNSETTTTAPPGGGPGGLSTTTTALPGGGPGGGTTTTALPGGGGGTVAGTVSFYMPYLHTNASAVTYCNVSNFSTSDLTTTFTVNAASTKPVGTPASFTTAFGAGLSQMITFTGSSVTLGSETKSIASDAGIASYGGTLKFTTTATGAISCKNVVMSCFQGTTSPKRNVVGYICGDDSTSGPGNNSIILGF